MSGATTRHTHSAGSSRVGADLIDAFEEMAPYLRGETAVDSYDLLGDLLAPERVPAIRRKGATSTEEFESQFRISARTMKAFEQRRRRPYAAMQPPCGSSRRSRRRCAGPWLRRAAGR